MFDEALWRLDFHLVIFLIHPIGVRVVEKIVEGRLRVAFLTFNKFRVTTLTRDYELVEALENIYSSIPEVEDECPDLGGILPLPTLNVPHDQL
ncbi:hypothetical protein B0H14DRAFT_3437773 [Mycena olivaceomarginata]|nr:hypothetical protein B0H14DRAFT_3437773 [Mycena olivaceomarginata]